MDIRANSKVVHAVSHEIAQLADYIYHKSSAYAQVRNTMTQAICVTGRVKISVRGTDYQNGRKGHFK